MNISEEQKELVFELLSTIMNDEDVISYSNLNNSLALIKGDGANWQSLASLGIHAAILYSEIYREKDSENNAKILGKLVGESLPFVKNLHKSLTGVFIPSKGNPFLDSDNDAELSLTDHDLRLLFYTRFALGFLLLAKEDKESAIPTFLRLARVQFLELNNKDDEHKSETINLAYSHDIGACKSIVVKFFIPYVLTEKEYSDYMEIIIKALECPDRDKSLYKYALDIMDLWSTYLEKEDKNSIESGWRDLLRSNAELMALGKSADRSQKHPRNCRIESPQFLVWNFGHYLGRYILLNGFPNIDTEIYVPSIEGTEYWENSIEESFSGDYPCWDFEGYTLMVDILDGIKYCSNYKELLEHCLLLWNNSPASDSMPFHNIASNCDLYWAIKIGIIEKLMEKRPEITDVIFAGPIETAVTRTSLEMIKMSQDISELKSILNLRLPKGADELTTFISSRLKEIWNRLPGSVINVLNKAEKLYHGKSDDEMSKVCFHKSVEAALNDCLLQPLKKFMQDRKLERMGVTFPLPKGRQSLSPWQLEKLSISDWSDILDYMISPQQLRGIQQIQNREMKEFMNKLFGGPHWPDIKPLIISLREISKLRGGSAHYQEAVSRYEKEERELEQIRSIILGIERPSILKQIYQLFPSQ